MFSSELHCVVHTLLATVQTAELAKINTKAATLQAILQVYAADSAV
jgi:hypothetical protein